MKLEIRATNPHALDIVIYHCSIAAQKNQATYLFQKKMSGRILQTFLNYSQSVHILEFIHENITFSI